MEIIIEIKEGDYISGRWRDPATGNDYVQEGTVKLYYAGLFVQLEDEGITPLQYFYQFDVIKKYKDKTK